MLFFKRSIAALLTFLTISLVSVLTSQAHAQETYPKSLASSTKDSCPMTQYLIVGKSPCVKKATPTQKLFPKEALIPTITPDEKKEETLSEPVKTQYFSSQEFSYTPGATLSADLLFEMVNQHRANISLPAFQKDAGVCSIAEGRKQEIVHEIFVTGALHAGFWADNHPFWATENVIWMHTEAEAMNWWLNSPVHRSAIEGDYAYACGTCNGEVCNMVFTSYTPKATVSASFTHVAQQPSPKPTAVAPIREEKPLDFVAQAASIEKSRLHVGTGSILR